MTNFPDKESDCQYCGGTGLIEKTDTYSLETGLPSITEGTGKMVRCFNCNAPDEDEPDQLPGEVVNELTERN